MSGLRDARPDPVVLHDGLVVPGALCAELAAGLLLLEAFLRGAPPPAAARAPRVSRAVLAVRVAAQEAAVTYQRRETQRRAFAATNAPQATVLTAAHVLSPSSPGDEITTARAATIAGVTEARIRQLAGAGTIRGRKTPRDVWLVDLGDVRAYAARRTRRSGTDGGTDIAGEAGRGPEGSAGAA